MLDIGQNILNERLKQSITQKRLAGLTGISQPNLSMIERGGRDLTVSTLRRISLALNIRASVLLGESEAARAAGVTLTRFRVEKIARLVVNRTALGSDSDERLAALFKNILPNPGAKRRAAKKTFQSWIELKNLLGQNQIRSVLERVRDEAQRAA